MMVLGFVFCLMIVALAFATVGVLILFKRLGKTQASIDEIDHTLRNEFDEIHRNIGSETERLDNQISGLETYVDEQVGEIANDLSRTVGDIADTVCDLETAVDELSKPKTRAKKK